MSFVCQILFFSLTGPLVLPDVILRSKYPSSLSVERLNSPQVPVIFLTLFLTSHAYMHCPNSKIRGSVANFHIRTNSLSFACFSLAITHCWRVSLLMKLQDATVCQSIFNCGHTFLGCRHPVLRGCHLLNTCNKGHYTSQIVAMSLQVTRLSE